MIYLSRVGLPMLSRKVVKRVSLSLDYEIMKSGVWLYDFLILNYTLIFCSRN